MKYYPDIRKEEASSVAYGEQICRRGKHVWVAYDGDKPVCVAATKPEARQKYRAEYFKWASKQVSIRG